MRSPYRRLPILPWCFLLLAACGPAEGPPTPASEVSGPSVILISFDTCRADLFGSLTGEEPSLSPRLDEFAADSVIFEKAFAQIPHTLPSHMSMMTSTYPDVHGVKPEQNALPESFTTLAEVFQQAGYRTVGLVTTEWLKADFGFSRGFDEYERLPHRRTYAERVHRAALRHLPSNREKPRFLFLHYYDLHSDFEHFPTGNKLPYYSPAKFRKDLEITQEGQEFCNDAGECNTRYLIALNREQIPVSEERTQQIHALYRAAVPHLDNQMGAFFDALKTRNLYDSSLIVISADHGEEFREHGRFIHSQPYEETLNIPLFIKFPGSWMGGARIDKIVETVDIFPTLLDYLKLEAPDYIQGKSALPLISRELDHSKEGVFSQDSINLSRYALRTADWKFILDIKASRAELYDLGSDPNELQNIVDSRPDLAQTLERRLTRSIRDNRLLHRSFLQGQSDDDDLLTSEERERLKALGYLN